MCIRDSIRAVDIFASNLFAMLPTIVILGVLSLCSMWLGSIVCEPRSACEVLKQAAYNLIVICLLYTSFVPCPASVVRVSMASSR